MRTLLRQIKRELKTAKHCAIYEEELNRVWPKDENRREPKLARFAQDNGFRLRFYREGLCAIFDVEPDSRCRAQPQGTPSRVRELHTGVASTSRKE
jgi:hypothetical protein